jgi:hypothetical protein
MAYLILEKIGDFQTLAGAGALRADDRCVLLTESLRAELPADWPEENIISPNTLMPDQERIEAIVSRLVLTESLIPTSVRVEFAEALTLVRRQFEAQLLVEAIGILPGDKRFIAASSAAAEMERPATHFMAELPGFRAVPIAHAGHLPVAGDRRSRAERLHPFLDILRASARRVGVRFVNPERLDAGPPAAIRFPEGRVRYGTWPDLRPALVQPHAADPGATSTLDVIVPVHNAAHLIAATADAILAGLTADDRLIMVENGSSDQSWEVISRLYGGHPNVVIDRLLEGDPASARNRGIEIGNGDYVAFCDADDLWSPAKPRYVKEVL